MELCVRRNNNWEEHFYNYPDDIDKVVDAAEYYKDEGDVYFSTYLFSKRSSTRDHALPSRTIQQDLDDADTSSLPLVPTILVETSPNRHQGFWVLSEHTDQHELLSKRLAYAIPLCDRTGWPVGRKVRIPGTINYKYPMQHTVQVVSVSNKRYTPEDVQMLPEIDIPSTVMDEDFINEPPTTYPVGPHELIEGIKDSLSAKVYAQYLADGPSEDRSASLFALLIQCFKAGLDRNQVYWIALHSPNNKFAELRFNADRELAKDVIRAENAVKTQSLNIRQYISDLRKATKMTVNERRRAIYDIVLGDLKREGEFVRSTDDRRYYVIRSEAAHDTTYTLDALTFFAFTHFC